MIFALNETQKIARTQCINADKSLADDEKVKKETYKLIHLKILFVADRNVYGNSSWFVESVLFFCIIGISLDNTCLGRNSRQKEREEKRIEQFIFIWNFILFVSKNCARNAIESISIVTFFSILFRCHSEESIATKFIASFMRSNAMCACALSDINWHM